MGEVEARAEPGAEAVEAGERGAASARPEAGDPGWREAVAAVAVRVARAFQRDRVLLHASALTYVTLLSLVPVLALAFAILTGLGVPRRLEPWIMGRISAGSEEIAQRILAYIDNIKVGSLGTVGVIGLLVTVVLVMGNIERAFNHIWGVDRPRRWSRKFADFLSVVLVFPFLILAASSLNAFLSHAPPPAVGGAARHLWVVTGRAILHAAPHLFVIAALTFLYIFMPNTRVRPSAALAGGVIAGVVLEVAQSLYLHFQIGAAKYNAIYGAMAQLPVFLVWIYLSWVVTLLGAEVAWAVQLEQGRRRVEAGWLPPASTLEWLHLELLRLVVQRYEAGEGASSAAGVAAATGLPEAACRGILEGLTDAGLLLSDGAEPAGYVPAEP
ncbi:MAG: YihY/virulence factor BrkB family protein, partial [Nitrospirae bacterium]